MHGDEVLINVSWKIISKSKHCTSFQCQGDRVLLPSRVLHDTRNTGIQVNHRQVYPGKEGSQRQPRQMVQVGPNHIRQHSVIKSVSTKTAINRANKATCVVNQRHTKVGYTYCDWIRFHGNGPRLTRTADSRISPGKLFSPPFLSFSQTRLISGRRFRSLSSPSLSLSLSLYSTLSLPVSLL